MQANPSDIGSFFHQQNVLIIPEYQRNYSWSEIHWQGLVRDIMEARTSKSNHWLGVILRDADEIYFKDGENKKKINVIDGQQRLITLRIWLAALNHHAEDTGQPPHWTKFADFEVQRVDQKDFNLAINKQWESYTRTKIEHGVMGAYYYFRWLLWLGEDALLSDDPIKPPSYSQKNKDKSPFELWEGALNKSSKSRPLGYVQSSSPDINRLVAATTQKLSVTSITIEQHDEEPSQIFATLNGQRQELAPLDFVRNWIFMRLKREQQDSRSVSEFYDKQWRPAEEAIEENKTKRVLNADLFLYDFLISIGERRRQNFNTKTTSAAFERYLSGQSTGRSTLDTLKKEFIPAMYLWPVAKGFRSEAKSDAFYFQLQDSATIRIIQSINSLSVGPPAPLILLYVSALQKKVITESELFKRLELIEGLLIRLMLVNEDLSPLRAAFIGMCSRLDGDISMEELRKSLEELWPDDRQVLDYRVDDPIYEHWRSNSAFILAAIEKALSGTHSKWPKFGKGAGCYSVEHIAPQSLTPWRDDLRTWGCDESELINRLHCLGNLTIADNEHQNKVKNFTFQTKRDYLTKDGAAAPVKLNDSWRNCERWTTAEIDARTIELRKKLVSYYKM